MAARKAQAEETAARPRRLRLPVVATRPTGGDFTWVTLGAPPDWQSLPGQFINILCEAEPGELAAAEGHVLDVGAHPWPRTTGIELARPWPVVRRPFSVARLRRGPGHVELDLLVRGIGKGSNYLRTRPVASEIDVVGPLGRAFTAPKEGRLAVLVGGGCGMAPMFGLADWLADAGRECLCFVGASTLGDMPVGLRSEPGSTGGRVERTDTVEEFAEDGIPAVLATDDGTAGFHGTVIDALRRWLDEAGSGGRVALYGCGPEPMLRGLAALADERDLACQVSLERWMGCGVGLCLSCVHKRKDPAQPKGWTFRLTCREGPVVDARDIIWGQP
jgi:dihydroorotate dehydrogenase electron transfer subunit